MCGGGASPGAHFDEQNISPIDQRPSKSLSHPGRKRRRKAGRASASCDWHRVIHLVLRRVGDLWLVNSDSYSNSTVMLKVCFLTHAL